MFREMRRKKQQMSQEETIRVLERGTHGVLAVAGEDGYPYAVPLSYVYKNGKLFFHCATAGHKLDAIEKEDKVSFCVVDQDQVMPKEYTTYFRSVIVFGKARVLEEEEEKRRAIQLLARRYSPEEEEVALQEAIKREYKALCMIELKIQHMTGKETVELVRKKQAAGNEPAADAAKGSQNPI